MGKKREEWKPMLFYEVPVGMRHEALAKRGSTLGLDELNAKDLDVLAGAVLWRACVPIAGEELITKYTPKDFQLKRDLDEVGWNEAFPKNPYMILSPTAHMFGLAVWKHDDEEELPEDPFLEEFKPEGSLRDYRVVWLDKFGYYHPTPTAIQKQIFLQQLAVASKDRFLPPSVNYYLGTDGITYPLVDREAWDQWMVARLRGHSATRKAQDLPEADQRIFFSLRFQKSGPSKNKASALEDKRKARQTSIVQFLFAPKKPKKPKMTHKAEPTVTIDGVTYYRDPANPEGRAYYLGDTWYTYSTDGKMIEDEEESDSDSESSSGSGSSSGSSSSASESDAESGPIVIPEDEEDAAPAEEDVMADSASEAEDPMDEDEEMEDAEEREARINSISCMNSDDDDDELDSIPEEERKKIEEANRAFISESSDEEGGTKLMDIDEDEPYVAGEEEEEESEEEVEEEEIKAAEKDEKDLGGIEQGEYYTVDAKDLKDSVTKRRQKVQEKTSSKKKKSLDDIKKKKTSKEEKKRAAEEKKRASEEKKRAAEEKKRLAAEEKLRKIEEKKRLAEEKRQALEEKKKKQQQQKASSSGYLAVKGVADIEAFHTLRDDAREEIIMQTTTISELTEAERVGGLQYFLGTADPVVVKKVQKLFGRICDYSYLLPIKTVDPRKRTTFDQEKKELFQALHFIADRERVEGAPRYTPPTANKPAKPTWVG